MNQLPEEILMRIAKFVVFACDCEYIDSWPWVCGCPVNNSRGALLVNRKFNQIFSEQVFRVLPKVHCAHYYQGTVGETGEMDLATESPSHTTMSHRISSLVQGLSLRLLVYSIHSLPDWFNEAHLQACHDVEKLRYLSIRLRGAEGFISLSMAPDNPSPFRHLVSLFVKDYSNLTYKELVYLCELPRLEVLAISEALPGLREPSYPPAPFSKLNSLALIDFFPNTWIAHVPGWFFNLKTLQVTVRLTYDDLHRIDRVIELWNTSLPQATSLHHTLTELCLRTTLPMELIPGWYVALPTLFLDFSSFVGLQVLTVSFRLMFGDRAAVSDRFDRTFVASLPPTLISLSVWIEEYDELRCYVKEPVEELPIRHRWLSCLLKARRVGLLPKLKKIEVRPGPLLDNPDETFRQDTEFERWMMMTYGLEFIMRPCSTDPVLLCRWDKTNPDAFAL